MGNVGLPGTSSWHRGGQQLVPGVRSRFRGLCHGARAARWDLSISWPIPVPAGTSDDHDPGGGRRAHADPIQLPGDRPLLGGARWWPAVSGQCASLSAADLQQTSQGETHPGRPRRPRRMSPCSRAYRMQAIHRGAQSARSNAAPVASSPAAKPGQMQRQLDYLCLQPTRQGQASHAHVNEIVAGLRHRGWEVRLIEPPLPGQRRADGIRRAIAATGVQIRYWAQCRFRPARFVYIRTHFLSLPTAFLARAAGALVVQEVNGPLEDTYDAWPQLRRLHRLITFAVRAQLRWADAVITVTPGLTEYVAGLTGRRGGCHVVGNGANVDQFLPAPDACRHRSPAVRRLRWCARVVAGDRRCAQGDAGRRVAADSRPSDRGRRKRAATDRERAAGEQSHPVARCDPLPSVRRLSWLKASQRWYPRRTGPARGSVSRPSNCSKPWLAVCP